MRLFLFFALLAAVLAAFGDGAWGAEPWPLPESRLPPPQTLRSPHFEKDAPVAPFVIRKVPLGNVNFYARAGLQADTVVRFSPDSQLLGIGTLLGGARVLDVYTGETLWEKRTPEGMVKQLAFSPDGATVFYGEQSPDAFVWAVEARSGRLRWRFRLADDLESSAPPARGNMWGIYELPGCYRLIPLEDGGVVVLGVHAWGEWDKPGAMRRLSRVYRFSATGERVWSFPAEGPAPMTFLYLDGDATGRRVAILTGEAAGDAPADFFLKPGSLCCLDGASGARVGTHVFAPLAPWFDRALFWQSVSVGQDGRTAAVGLHDGRSFLFDLEQCCLKKTFYLGTPISISGIPVSAGATYTHVAPDGVIYFQTGNSSVASGAGEDSSRPPPGAHPSANTITAMGPEGVPRWRFRGGHHYQNFWTSADGRWVLTSAQKNEREGVRNSGAMLFDTSRPGGGSEKFVYYYEVEGLSFFQADISPDGAAIAVVEIPYMDPKTKRLRGQYQVHIIR